MLKIGVFTVMLPDLSPEDAAPALHEAGYHGVEWRVTAIPENRRAEAPSFWGNNLCTFAPTDADAERADYLARENGLAIPGLGTYIDVGDVDATENAMRFAKTCGAGQIRISAGRWPDGDRTYAEIFASARAFLADAQDLAQQYGVKALVEIHHGTIIPSASLAYRLVHGFDPAHIGVIHDAGNMVHEGYEHYRMGLELLGDYTAHVHVKNGAWKRPDGANVGVWKSHWSPLDDGTVDFDALFAALRAVGYQGWVGVEDFSNARPSREALRWNLDFLNGVIDRAYTRA
jgi:sugar phosphate isomerase/epimerase